MYLFERNKRKRQSSLSFIILLMFLAKFNYAQNYHKTFSNQSNIDSIKNTISTEIKGSVLPKANIRTLEGDYHLKSAITSSFSFGINYQIKHKKLWGIKSGFHLNLTKRNFYLHIPDSDLPAFFSSEGAPQIEDKEVNIRLIIPLRIIRMFQSTNQSFWDLKAGINFNYSGFSKDEIINMNIADTNFQTRNIFYGNFKTNNNKKLWVSFIISSAKNFYLKNNNQFSIDIFFEFSNTKFIKGDYEITIPDKQITRGSYSITGSYIGIGLQYTFTGSNKKMVEEYEKK